VAAVNASGSYSSLDRWVFQGDRLAPQVIHSPCALDMSTLWYFLSVRAPVAGSWSRVSTAIGDGRRPYMLVTPSWASDAYSNCTTQKTGWATPSTFAPSRWISEVPSGQSEKNCRGDAATEVSMMALLAMS